MLTKTITRAIALCTLAAAPVLIHADQPIRIPAEPGQAIQAQTYRQILKEIERESLVKLPENWEKFKALSPTTNEELRLMLTETLAAIGNPGLKMLTKGQLAQLTAAEGGGYAGIGAAIELGPVITDGIVIEKVLPDSTGEDAGLKAGDLITAVNGKQFSGWSLLEVTEVLLRGLPATSVELTVRRGLTTEKIVVERDVEQKLGIVIKAVNPRYGFVVTSDIHPDTPAALAGLAKGDVLKEIDGQNAAELALTVPLSQYIDERSLGMDLKLKQLSSLTSRWARADMALTEAITHYIREGALGSAIKLKLSRGGQSKSIAVVRGVVSRGDFQMMTAMASGSGNGWSQLRLTNLNWRGLIPELDKRLEEYKLLPGLILDLRGAQGSDANLAAQLLARFVPPSGPLIATSAKSEGSIFTQIYSSSPAPHRYEGKMVVLTDSNTSGTAEAVAAFLQAQKRATIRGQATAGKTVLSSPRQWELGDGSNIALLIPRQQLLAGNASAQPAVQPDNKDVAVDRPDYFDEVSKRARDDLSGASFSSWPLALIVGGGLFVVICLFAFLGRRKAGSQEKEEAKPADSEPLSARQAALALLAAALILGGLVTLRWYLDRPPAGMHGELLVKVYVDDSPLSKAQEKVVRQLESEYKGPIRFEIADGKNDPDIRYFPTVRVYRYWYDDKGNTISSGWSQRGECTKRQMVEEIERAIHNETASNRPALTIERHKKVN